jgi:hypothetical protein
MAEVCAVCLDPPIRTRNLPWFICTWLHSNAALARYCDCKIWVHPHCMQQLIENRTSNCIYCSQPYIPRQGTLSIKLILRSAGLALLVIILMFLLLCILLLGLYVLTGIYWDPVTTAAALARLWYAYLAVGFVLTFLRSDGGAREIPVDVLAPATAALVLYLVHGSAWLTADNRWLLVHFCVLCVAYAHLTYEERRKFMFYHPIEISWG